MQIGSNAELKNVRPRLMARKRLSPVDFMPRATAVGFGARRSGPALTLVGGQFWAG
jgi:hypothetical protein